MAKKVRRPRRRRTKRSSANIAAKEDVQASTQSLTAQEEFEAEYAYVLKDLRWVFILAGIMFALLIILNLVLTA